MPPARTAPRPRIALFLITVACLLSAVALTAQSVGSGVIAGRIFNPATGQYLRNAEIRVVATGQAVTSGNEGDFRISPVAAGQAKLVVTYTGYRTATAIVDVTAGATVTRDFDLISSLQAEAAAGEPVKLTAQEYKLLSYLLHHKGKVVSRTELIEHIYDQDFDRDSNTIEVFVGRLRKKIGADRIETVRGLGYRLTPLAGESDAA